MLLLISPAKTLDYETTAVTPQQSQPRYLPQSESLIANLRHYSEEALGELMKISSKLAQLNHQRYVDWSLPFTPENAKQAILAMKGGVYTGLDAESFSEDEFSFSQKHLRILSGLYGLLRPLDLMQPYRLEMGTRLSNDKGINLYAFWGELITQQINQDLADQGDDVVINLASNEYFKAVKPSLINGRLVDVQFKEQKDDGYKVVGVHAKRARGVMGRFIIRNQLTEVEEIKSFSELGYGFNAELSAGSTWVFSR
ncbi:MAG: peroxide stress protein YaaA [Candidatus Polarisedimenticolaceae bacterium]|nr:peroxide stress protein YaaA [Candidatus Polarisedimenticolaceae bacterium]